MDKPGAARAPNDGKCAETNKLGYRSKIVTSAVQLLRRTLPIAMMLLAVIAVPLLVLEPEGLPRLHGLERELDEVTTENQELRRNIERLRIEVQRLREDPAAVERIARSELGMVRKTEVVFQFGR
jgi:cell division protein FtsB